MGPRLFSLVLLSGLAFAVLGRAADSSDVNHLALEVDALQMLAQLQLEPSQLKALAKLAAGSASSSERKPAKASAKYVAALKELRKALIEGDADPIDELNEKLDKLRESEKPEIDNKVQPDATAKKRAAEAFKLLTVRQTTEFLANFGEQLPDPAEVIKNTLQEGSKLGGKQWETVRDHAAEQLGWLVAGFDDEKASKVREQALTLFNKLHGKNLNEGDAQKEARTLSGDVTPTDVLRHIVEHDLAELLANPGLPAAIAAHLKK